MYRLTFIFLLLTITHTAIAQKESFDLLNFSPPKDWKKTINAGNVTYSFVDTPKNKMCIISVYRSVPGNNNVQTDFDSQWNEIALKQFGIETKPSIKTPVSLKDWNAVGGTALYQNSGFNMLALLTVMSGHNKAVSILSLTNSNDYFPIIQQFLASVDVNAEAPDQKDNNNNSITISTTNFDDGWSATVQNDYILLNKSRFKAYIFYKEPFNNESRKNTVDYFLQHQFSTLFTFTNIIARSDNYHYYIEGNARENASGKDYYVAMDVVANNGFATTVIAVSPSQAEHTNQFGNDLKNMVSHNRFGIAAQDLVGSWGGGSGSSISYYDYNGNNVGTNAVVMSDKFMFTGNAGFEAEFKGGTGMVGNMKMYQQHYKGTFSVPSSWQISTTDQDHKTVLYDCWFEAVRGGVILHLINHQYTGDTFDLIKEK